MGKVYYLYAPRAGLLRVLEVCDIVLYSILSWEQAVTEGGGMWKIRNLPRVLKRKENHGCWAQVEKTVTRHRTRYDHVMMRAMERPAG